MSEYALRPITGGDNIAVANIIRTVMPEFKCVGEGYSINDPEVDHMFEAFQGVRANFYVIEQAATGVILGCGGYAPLAGSQHPDTCELQKMYFLPALRGLGWGHRLLHHCMAAARADEYRRMYLETVNRMEAAGKLYRKAGFRKIPAQMGATGHGGCDTFMIIDL